MELAQLVEAFAVKKSKTGVKAMITRMRTKTSRTTRITRFSLSLFSTSYHVCKGNHDQVRTNQDAI